MFHSIKVLHKYLVLEKTEYTVCYFIAFIDISVCTYIQMWASQAVLVVKNPLKIAGDTRDVGLIPGWVRNGAGHDNCSIFA